MNNPTASRRLKRGLLAASVLLSTLPAPAQAQSLPAKGTAATLDVATWNIEWFGAEGSGQGPSNDAQQIANAEAIIAAADIDLWGVQEIASTEAFNTLLAGLGDAYTGVLATNSGQQRIGFIYKPDIIQPLRVRHILTHVSSDFASRPPLELRANVVLGDTTVVMNFITVHMKAFSDLSSYERRTRAGQALKNHIDFTSLNTDAVVILGDFNDTLTGSITAGRGSPYSNFLGDPDNYLFPTLALEQAGSSSYCWNDSRCTTGSMIDHILITNELFDVYEATSADRYDEVLDHISRYVVTTSDHLPIFARFRLTTGTSTGRVPELPVAARITALFPNPFADTATLTLQLPAAGSVVLGLYDALGRRQERIFEGYLQAGAHAFSLDLMEYPAGMYLLRLQGESGGQTLPVLKH